VPTELLCICHYTYRWVQCSVLCTRSLSKHFIWFVFFVCFVVLLCLPSSSAPVCFYLRSHVAGSMLKCMRMRRWTRSTRLWQMMKLFIRARSPHTYAMHADEEMYPWHEPPASIPFLKRCFVLTTHLRKCMQMRRCTHGTSLQLLLNFSNAALCWPHTYANARRWGDVPMARASSFNSLFFTLLCADHTRTQMHADEEMYP